jgi:ABC-type glycerol-3-phosphate transport system substrate-binding protein
MKQFAALLVCVLLTSCQRAPDADDRVVVRYWEKWNGFEGDAMRAVVDDFNASQDRIRVEFTSVSQIDRRLMLAIAGGVPPDVAGVWANTLAVYAENNALTPLDKLAASTGLGEDHYIPAYWEMCRHLGHLWALPSTPSAMGLVWNKKLFREAGLDPEKPPGSIAELEAMNERLTRRGSDGRLEAVGYLPVEPGWWNATWGWWFGGRIWDGKGRITLDSPENIEAFDWIESYPRRFGAKQLMSFRDGFGNFTSPQNPFFTGRVAMVIQGPWIYNFIRNYAPPDFEWGVAAFPSADPARNPGVAIVDADVLVIPAGARHPKEAFEFLRYVNSREPMEKLCLGQRKFTPLRETSPGFLENHPNPHIGEFLALARGENARFFPQLTVWNQLQNEMNQAFDRVWTGREEAAPSLRQAQERVADAFAHRQRRWAHREPFLRKEWSNQ